MTWMLAAAPPQHPYLDPWAFDYLGYTHDSDNVYKTGHKHGFANLSAAQQPVVVFSPR
eukprot:CAMPEP_0175906396 /NCGR_PEP_ID=MMETSP0108-20121206/5523_1 /TAXON_ID=195067 ORGANISM="Goniomonas pacifica, Strain CCMP1869" /NCGR_SAMPLE_ID=MMETSP0108 /ASSEMBLY_ACC=CAM_ASM_000204 /LENGTH=57 /DNA_ID=CAMNT_0017228343 /DNA_START=101 /DNA_END=274 /DNA_ORIENTATION=-